MKTITILTFGVILCSCSVFEDEYSDLSIENSFYYNTADTLIYVSNLSEQDTFIVSTKTIDYRISDKRYHYQYEQVGLKRINSDNNFRIYHENTFFEISWADFYCLVYFSENPQMIEYVLNDITIKNVYVINNSTQNFGKIYYNNKYGIIRYDINNIQYFELKLDN